MGLYIYPTETMMDAFFKFRGADAQEPEWCVWGDAGQIAREVAGAVIPVSSRWTIRQGRGITEEGLSKEILYKRSLQDIIIK